MRDAIANTHSLRRTSPKGQAFVGCCALCGKQDLPFEAAREYCENPIAVGQEQAIIDAVSGDA